VNAPLVVSIGTTHPWNIAGTGLDARVCAEYRVAHAAALVAVSAQDARGVRALEPLPLHLIRAQLASMPRIADAYCIGALGSADAAGIVSAFVAEHAGRVPVVLDPVTEASLGGRIERGEGLVETIRDRLLSLPVIVTPNLPECEQLIGHAVAGVDQQLRAAHRLTELGARAAYVKGGHRSGDPVDVLADRHFEEIFSDTRLPGSMRGSGSVFAAALACELASGRDLRDAAASARTYTRAKIAAATMRHGVQVAFP
jgi:hydroxymethylpyrimidine/phosphomethylpyrimidine kinase